MSLKDITSEAVCQAIAEFDKVGREHFLRRYGFRESKDYFLIYNGQAYDSKAIVGVAHKFLPNGHVLSSREFTDRKGGAAKQLERLAFVIQTSGQVAAVT
jgi:5-methylcytosine-specific restriction protein A